ncbi:class I SAM-dependent methyltransferase [Salinicoccus sp. ID82-1]|uniref:Class I SAM-dependent methyltransferase n=1 Tax=Salinicoccus cyprini TaxID=2493691 RepID=A0A558AQY2_9STAP|nr:class I SAM-dependent methyltransferase [Salinicoccus cyprini]MCG1010290.1 class I SAM-dependent methyltransferase [Salinicoccus sp. ID82-1]TVT26658.1 class I SAM-dependent methyltransferase [Salinicoccus cyprini]
MVKNPLIRKFDRQARSYDRRRDGDSTRKYRQRIFSGAEGRVLEVAVGAGANFPFYDADIELTGIDFSPEMLKAARTAARDYAFDATFIEGDVERAVFEENSFDTIVSSLSFCAYQDPEKVLEQFQKWCRPEGRILMMEHGLSTNGMVAKIQQISDRLSLKLVGCHQDRHITEIVQQSDLELVEEERHLMGCLYLLWAKP